MQSKDRIIVALDVDHPSKAIALVSKLAPFVGSFKVGLELITAMIVSILVGDEETAIANAKAARELFRLIGKKCFWDGKFDDIPNTVGAASKIVGQTLGANMLNVHASAGIPAMMAAVVNRGSASVAGVSVLTSKSPIDTILDFGAPPSAQVLYFARNMKLAGCTDIICSPLELGILNTPELCGIRKVTPGIRSPEDPPDDQNRTMTPREAIAAGADELVIGRPITKAKDPEAAARDIALQITYGLIDRFHLAMFVEQKVKFGAFKLKLHETQPDAPLSPIYLNIRQLPEWMYELAGDILHDLAIAEKISDFDYVVGIPKAGDPIGRAFAKAVGKPHLRIEKVETATGRHITSNILDPFEKGKKVVLIDDLVTRAQTKEEAIASIEANGLQVVATLVLCDREQGGLAELNAKGRKVCAAFTLRHMLDFLYQKKLITVEKHAEILRYIAGN